MHFARHTHEVRTGPCHSHRHSPRSALGAMVLGLALAAPAATSGATAGAQQPPGALQASTHSHPVPGRALATRARLAAPTSDAVGGHGYGALALASTTVAPTVYARRVC